MNSNSLRSLITVLILAGLTTVANAQFRDQQTSPFDYTGPVVKTQVEKQTGSWANLFNMKMSQSYSMSFASIGGQYQNINTFTNTMQFQFSDRLTGRMDVSLMHSPFGGSFNNSLYGNDVGAKLFIRNAQLDYQLSKNSHISIQFQQRPYSFGFGGPWGGGYYDNPFYDNRSTW